MAKIICPVCKTPFKLGAKEKHRLTTNGFPCSECWEKVLTEAQKTKWKETLRSKLDEGT